MWTLRTEIRDPTSDKPQIHALMKPYQKEICNIILASDTPISTGEMWIKLQEKLGIDCISRASVIFFMSDLHKNGFLTFKEQTGKGGYHRVYRNELTKEEFCLRISNQVMHTLANELSNLFN